MGFVDSHLCPINQRFEYRLDRFVYDLSTYGAILGSGERDSEVLRPSLLDETTLGPRLPPILTYKTSSWPPLVPSLEYALEGKALRNGGP